MRSGDEISELQLGVARHKHTAIVHLNLTLTLTLTIGPKLASFPGPARSSLAVRNSRRGPGLVHHVMSATAYVTPISLTINDVIG